MSDRSYLEVIKRKLDDLLDRILQREASEDKYRAAYAQILEKINSKMDFMSSSGNVDSLALMGDEIKSLINLKDDTLQKKMKIIIQEQEEILEKLQKMNQTPEALEAIQEIHENLSYFSNEIQAQKDSFNSIMSYIEKFGTLEKTNQLIEDEFSLVKDQQFANRDAISEQFRALNDQSKEYNEKFVEIIVTINQDLNNILEQTKQLPEGEDYKSVNQKIENAISELDSTKEFILNINNNLMTLIDVVDNIFQNEDIDKIHENIGQLLVNTTILSEATQKLLTKEETEKILSDDKGEIKSSIAAGTELVKGAIVENTESLKNVIKEGSDDVKSAVADNCSSLKDSYGESHQELKDITAENNTNLRTLLTENNQELKEYNEDLVRQLEENILGKLDISSLESIRDYTEKMFYQGTEVLKEEIWTIKDTVTNVKGGVAEIKDSIDDKLENLKAEILAPQALKIDDIHDSISDLVSAQSVETSGQIGVLTSLIEGIKSDTLSEMQSQLIAQFVQIAQNISFLEDAQEIHDHITTSNEEIRSDLGILREFSTNSTQGIINLLELINTNLTRVAGHDSYSLPHVESDLSKIQADLKNISRTLISESDLSDENLKDIYSNVVKLRSSMENLESTPIAEELREVRTRFEDINSDISSISKRTNKLILNSDEVNKTLQGHIDEFTQIVNYFGNITNKFENDSVINVMSKKLDSLAETSNALFSSDKLINEALMSMAEWVDSISDSFSDIKENVYDINTAIASVEQLGDKVEEQELKLLILNEKIDSLISQRTEINEMKSLLEFVASQITAANEKLEEDKSVSMRLDAMEKHLKKIDKNVNTLTAYIEEE